MNNNQQQIHISWTRPRDRIDGYYQLRGGYYSFVRTNDGSDAETTFTGERQANFTEGARIAGQMRAVAETVAVLAELGIRTVAAPVDFVWSAGEDISHSRRRHGEVLSRGLS